MKKTRAPIPRGKDALGYTLAGLSLLTIGIMVSGNSAEANATPVPFVEVDNTVNLNIPPFPPVSGSSVEIYSNDQREGEEIAVSYASPVCWDDGRITVFNVDVLFGVGNGSDLDARDWLVQGKAEDFRPDGQLEVTQLSGQAVRQLHERWMGASSLPEYLKMNSRLATLYRENPESVSSFLWFGETEHEKGHTCGHLHRNLNDRVHELAKKLRLTGITAQHVVYLRQEGFAFEAGTRWDTATYRGLEEAVALTLQRIAMFNKDRQLADKVLPVLTYETTPWDMVVGADISTPGLYDQLWKIKNGADIDSLAELSGKFIKAKSAEIGVVLSDEEALEIAWARLGESVNSIGPSVETRQP